MVHGYTIVLALIGAGLLVVRGWWPPIESLPSLASFVEGLGVAFLVAAVLTETVDESLKRRLLRDAFEASFGYVLHEELKPELTAILEHRILCVDHEQKCQLRRDGDAVIVRMMLRRTYENVGHDLQELGGLLAIDEWCNPHGTSRILRMGYLRGSHYEDLDVDKPEKSLDGVLKIKFPELWLEPGGRVTTWSEFEEVKQLNDVYHMFFKHPTVKPRVTVRIQDDRGETDGIAGFAHRTESHRACGGEYSELPGTLLVSQPITIRWWNKVQVANTVDLGEGER